MKIFILGSAHPLRGGGISTFNERLAFELQNLGHEVKIISFKYQYPNFLFPGKSQTTDEPAPEGIQIENRMHSVNPFNWWKLGNQIAREKPDMVITRYWLPFFGACLGTIHRRIRKNKHTKITAIIDNLIPHEKRPGDKVLTQYFLPSCDSFLTMSREVKKDLEQWGVSQPIVYAPHPMYDLYGAPIDKAEARKKLGLPQGNKYMLFFGFIRKYKGLDLLLEAMDDDRLRHSNVHLIVAGEYYNDRAYYEEIIQRLNIADRVHLFTDFIPNAEVGIYFSAADFVVQPYRTATQSGISQIAYYYKKPMVVTDVGGLPEIVPHGVSGFVVKPEPSAIAQAIVSIQDDNTLAGMVSGLENERKKYEWTHFVEKLLSV